MKCPLGAEFVAGEIVRERGATRACFAMARFGDGLRQVTAFGVEPAVVRPFDGLKQGLATEGSKTVFVAVVHHPPVATFTVNRRPFNYGGMAARPPGFCLRQTAYQGVVRAVLPRTVNGTRARGNHHMASDGACGAAHRRDQIEPVAAFEQLGAFGGEVFHNPVIRVDPRAIGRLQLAVGRQAVIGQADFADAIHKQITFAVFTHHVAGVDAPFNLQVDRVAPRAIDIVRPNHIGRPRLAVGERGNINVIAVAMFADIQGPHGADIAR